MKMRSLVVLLLAAIWLNSCIQTQSESVNNLVKDFNLSWRGEAKYQTLFANNDHTEYGGAKVIEETVYSLGYDENFIIAKQHPNLSAVKEKILKNQEGEDFLIENPQDTVYLNTEFIYAREGKYLYKKSGVPALDNLFPYKSETIYYIVDIRDYSLRFWGTAGNVHKFRTQTQFDIKRKELGVPESLQFSLTNPELE